jgi:hypothetical protein
MTEWDADQAAQQAFVASIPKALETSQKRLLVALFKCAKRQDLSVQERHAALGTLAGLDVSSYFTHLGGLKNSGLVMDDGQGPRINHAALLARVTADRARKIAMLASGRSLESA